MRPPRRRGFVVVISDFLGDRDWERPLRGLRPARPARDRGGRSARARAPASGCSRWSTPRPARRWRCRPATRSCGRSYADGAAAQRAEIAAALRRAGAGHLQLRTDRDWLIDIVRFVADRRRAGTEGPAVTFLSPVLALAAARGRRAGRASTWCCSCAGRRTPRGSPTSRCWAARAEAAGLAAAPGLRRVALGLAALVVALAVPAPRCGWRASGRRCDGGRRLAVDAGHGRRARPASGACRRRPRSSSTCCPSGSTSGWSRSPAPRPAWCRRPPTATRCSVAIDNLGLAERTAIGEAIFSSLTRHQELPVEASSAATEDAAAGPDRAAVRRLQHRRPADPGGRRRQRPPGPGVDDRLRHRLRHARPQRRDRAGAGRPGDAARRSPTTPAAATARRPAPRSWSRSTTTWQPDRLHDRAEGHQPPGSSAAGLLSLLGILLHCSGPTACCNCWG